VPRAVVGRTSVGFGCDKRPARQTERDRLVVGVVEATGPGRLEEKQSPGRLEVRQAPGRQTCAFHPAFAGTTASPGAFHQDDQPGRAPSRPGSPQLQPLPGPSTGTVQHLRSPSACGYTADRPACGRANDAPSGRTRSAPGSPGAIREGRL